MGYTPRASPPPEEALKVRAGRVTAISCSLLRVLDPGTEAPLYPGHPPVSAALSAALSATGRRSGGKVSKMPAQNAHTGGCACERRKASGGPKASEITCLFLRNEAFWGQVPELQGPHSRGEAATRKKTGPRVRGDRVCFSIVPRPIWTALETTELYSGSLSLYCPLLAGGERQRPLPWALGQWEGGWGDGQSLTEVGRFGQAPRAYPTHTR